MLNYNTQLQSNNTDLQQVLQSLQNKAAGGGEQATPVISVSSNGLITATAGTKTSTHQLAFQSAKTITPSSTSQIAVSSGYYTGGNITVAAVSTQTKTVTPTSTTQNVTPDSGKFLSKVTVVGDANLVAGNIKSGVSIFGVNGTLEEGGSDIETEIVEYSENEDAIISRTISGTYFNDRIQTIGGGAFAGCSSLTSVKFPACTTINAVTKAGAFSPIGAFQNCDQLISVSFPSCTSIGANAFYGCSKLPSVSFPVCTTIGGGAFSNCYSLATISFPACTTIGSNAFHYCYSLTTASFPACTTIGSNAFQYCNSLTTASFPVCTTIGYNAFNYCNSLTTASFPACTTIDSRAFFGCRTLSSLILGASSVCTLQYSNAFSSTPYAGYSAYFSGTPYIYVPSSLMASYKASTNWAYFSSYFSAIEDMT